MSYWERQAETDEWYTPKYLFDALGCSFDLDVASPHQRLHVPAKVWLDREDDGLKLAEFWTGFIWMNAPFGGPNGLVPWLDVFFKHGNGIALTPDRTSAGWFRSAWARADAVLFLPKVRFIREDGSIGANPSTGTALFAAGEKAVMALRRCASSGLGILAMPVKFNEAAA